MKRLSLPTEAWGPADPANRTGKYAKEQQPLIAAAGSDDVEVGAFSAVDVTTTYDNADDKQPPVYFDHQQSDGITNQAYSIGDEHEQKNISRRESTADPAEQQQQQQATEMKDVGAEDSGNQKADDTDSQVVSF